jgi:branched-chain amino acid transport system substrate-binding protein
VTRRTALAAASVAVAVAAAPAWSLGRAAPTITIGTTGLLTGAGASVDVVRGEQAYFRFVNARGGVNGRQIDFEALDDGGDAARAVANARNLIEKDNALALFSVIGSDANLAVADVAGAAQVPQVFSAGTARALSLDSSRYPLTTGYPPSAYEVAEVYARHVLATSRTTAKVAVLYANATDGRDGLAGLREGLGKQGAGLLAATEAVSPTATDVASALRRLKASGANTLALFVPGPVAVLAYKQLALIGWQPQVYIGTDVTGTPFARLGSSPAVEGSISVLWARDPGVGRFAHDSGAKLATQINKRYGMGGVDGAVVAGMAAAYSFVDALEQAGPNPTRSTLLGAVDSLNEVSNPFLVPGAEVHMTPAHRFPVTQMLLVRRHAGRWVAFGGIQSAPR